MQKLMDMVTAKLVTEGVVKACDKEWFAYGLEKRILTIFTAIPFLIIVNGFYRCTGNTAYYVGDVDSDFGAKTHSAVLTFQANMGLTSDGIVGWGTWTTFHTRWLADLHGCKLEHVG